MFGRLLRVIVNSLGFIILVVISVTILPASPLLSFLFMLAALDQLEDVYFYVYGKHLLPYWMFPVDVVMELILFVTGLIMLLYALIYFNKFQGQFFLSMIPLSVLIMYSSLEDIGNWFERRRFERGARFVRQIR